MMEKEKDMAADPMELTQVLHFKLEKFDDKTGELLEVIEGGDGQETRVTYQKEQDHGDHQRSS